MICRLLHNLAPIMSNFRIRGIRFVLHLGSGVGYCPYGAVGGMKGSSLLTLGEKRRKTEVSTPLLYYRAKRV